MAVVEPIIVVLGPFGGGTSAVAAVLHHLGVFMGARFDLTYRGPYETWEESQLGALCRNAFTAPGGQLQMDADVVLAKLDGWADGHRRAAAAAGCRPGVKIPILCAAVDLIRLACGPIVPVVVDRPVDKTVASLNKLGWWTDEQERIESTKQLIAARDQALAGTRFVRVDFEALRAAPAATVRRIAEDLGLVVTEAQVAAAVASIVQPAAAGAASRDPYGQVRDRLLATVQADPEDGWAVFMLAATYFDSGDFANARTWYARRAEMAGSGEDIYYATFRLAESMSRLGEPWPQVEDAYLRAFELRPTRAEPLYALAGQSLAKKRYQSAYLFADRAARIPLPADDSLFEASVYTWRALDLKATCAYWIGRRVEAFTLCRQLLARADIPEADRQRIACNRDFSVPAMIEAASSYPDAVAGSLVGGPPDVEVTATLIAGPARDVTEATLNSFLHCCTDISRVGRFLILDAGLSAEDRATLGERYRFVEFVDARPDDTPDTQLARIRAEVGGRFWLHLGQGWRFFAPDNLIGRLTGILGAEPQVVQVGVNFTDATQLTETCAIGATVRRAAGTGGYLLTDSPAVGPAMVDTTRLDQAGRIADNDPNSVIELARRVAAAGLHTATLDEVLCIGQPAAGGPHTSGRSSRPSMPSRAKMR